MIRALREVADLPVAAIGQTLAIVDYTDSHDGDVPDHLGVALRALRPPLDIPPDENADYDRAARRIDEILRDPTRCAMPCSAPCCSNR